MNFEVIHQQSFDDEYPKRSSLTTSLSRHDISGMPVLVAKTADEKNICFTWFEGFREKELGVHHFSRNAILAYSDKGKVPLCATIRYGEVVFSNPSTGEQLIIRKSLF